ncbi:MAG TPA: S1 RNA-binding domain-containing protein, partial [Candidatus Limnocylindrales bacterium]|nr:S1 RNA-binding domain-containing protein [Candidatus Limnocylindrales bacterium]
MTEEQQGGTTPPAEAIAEAPAPEQTDATVAVADDPAETPIAESQGAEATETAPSAEAPEPDSPNGVEASMGDAEPEAAAEAGEAPAEPEIAAPEAEVAAPDAEIAAPDAEIAAPADAPAAADDATAAPETEAPAADAPAADVAPEPEPEPAIAEAPEAKPAPRPRPTGPEPTTMEELLAEQDSDIKSFKHGDVVEGSVVRIDKDEILVDIGAKSEGVVSNRELFGRHGESQPALNIGDVVLVYVLQPESPEGHVVLSLRRAGLERKWRAMQEQFEAGVIIEA